MTLLSDELFSEIAHEYGEDVANTVSLLIEGTFTDGGHHKQWYLDQAVRMLAKNDYDKLRADVKKKYGYTWDKGIAP